MQLNCTREPGSIWSAIEMERRDERRAACRKRTSRGGCVRGLQPVLCGELGVHGSVGGLSLQAYFKASMLFDLFVNGTEIAQAKAGLVGDGGRAVTAAIFAFGLEFAEFGGAFCGECDGPGSARESTENWGRAFVSSSMGSSTEEKPSSIWAQRRSRHMAWRISSARPEFEDAFRGASSFCRDSANSS